jgi:AcrR family transcriptional regulator
MQVLCYAAGVNAQAGLRERKKQRTRETIVRVALELFEERGYGATTLAEIAEAADISTRTIFSYFRSKEDIVFAHVPGLEAELARALDERPAGKDALETLRDFIVALDTSEKAPLHARRERIIDSDETLRSHKRARLAELEDLVAAAIARDLDAAANDLRPRVVAAALIAAFEAVDEKEAGRLGAGDVAAAIDPVFTFLRGGLEALKTPTPPQP